MPEVVLITGASSGIGRALSLAWGRRRAAVVLSGRDRDALARVGDEVRALGGSALVEPGDVTRDEHRRRLVDRALDAHGRLDVLVNNAGRGYYGAARTIDIDELEALFALNVSAPLGLSQLAAAPLARSSGCIVMMSSVVGLVAAPRMAAYATTKFALEGLAMALRAELAESGVRVLVVRPGPVDTPFRAHAVTSEGGAGVRPPGARVQSAEQVAEATLAAIERGRAVIETSLFVRAASLATRVAPSVVRGMLARMARPHSK